MGYVIGCDLGSQSAKAVLMSPEGAIVATASSGYAMAHPHSGWAEQDPAHYRHIAQFSDWKIDPPLAADAFAFMPPAGTVRIPFAPPGATEKGK